MTIEEIDTELSRLHEELCSTTMPANRRRILHAIDKLLDQRLGVENASIYPPDHD